MTTTTKSISLVLASLFLALDTSLVAWNWYLRPEHIVAWAAALAMLGVMTAALSISSRRSRREGADGSSARAVAGAVVLAGLTLAISLSARLAPTLGVDHDFSERAMMVMIGLFLAYTGNTIPKTLTPLSALQCDVVKVQACRRVVGWTWVLAGLAVAAVWIALPDALATAASMALMVSAVSLTLVQIIRSRRLRTRAA